MAPPPPSMTDAAWALFDNNDGDDDADSLKPSCVFSTSLPWPSGVPLWLWPSISSSARGCRSSSSLDATSVRLLLMEEAEDVLPAACAWLESDGLGDVARAVHASVVRFGENGDNKTTTATSMQTNVQAQMRCLRLHEEGTSRELQLQDSTGNSLWHSQLSSLLTGSSCVARETTPSVRSSSRIGARFWERRCEHTAPSSHWQSQHFRTKRIPAPMTATRSQSDCPLPTRLPTNTHASTEFLNRATRCLLRRFTIAHRHPTGRSCYAVPHLPRLKRPPHRS
ncbi:JmjC domain-containing protein [Pycnococcus provasolii]